MSKLSDWMSKSVDNRVFIAGVAALALTSSAYIGTNYANKSEEGASLNAYAETVVLQNSIIDDELDTLGENYWHLQDMLENGDVNGAIELASSMKEHISDMRASLSQEPAFIVSASVSDSPHADRLNALQGIYEDLEIALKNDNVSLFSDAVARIHESLTTANEEYEAASFGM